MLGWPNHPIGGDRPPLFFLSVRGILGINRLNELNYHNLKVWGVKCHILNFGGKSENG
jgi:hypothetical protein